MSMSKEELIIGFFEKGYCCDLDEVKNTCLGLLEENKKLQQENEKNKHYKTLYQSLKKQKEELRDYLKARIEVCDNRLSTPFCNIEKATKERLILNQCLEKMEELEQPKKELLKPSHYDEEIDVEYELEKARKFIQEDKKRKFERNSNE